MGKFSKNLMLVLSIAAYSNAFAQVDCTGTVDELSLQLIDDSVVFSLSGGPSFTVLCSISEARNGVSAMGCRTMYSTLMAAKMTKKKVLIRFNDAASCAAVPSWSNAGSVGWTRLLLD